MGKVVCPGQDVRILLDDDSLPKGPLLILDGRFLALVLQLQIGYGFRSGSYAAGRNSIRSPLGSYAELALNCSMPSDYALKFNDLLEGERVLFIKLGGAYGKRFAFIRFIKVDTLDRLIDNLCTIWIESFHLHANIARFQRESKPTSTVDPDRVNIRKKTLVEASRNDSVKSVPGSYVFAVKKGPLNSVKEKEMQPALVLDDSCYLV
ncbi:hypothetical protein Tco_0018608 [Tanacetum coccineum]